MENASKALLIAAGVLIVILLIAFGMSIFNSTGDTSGQVESQAQSTSMQTFNAQFAGYIGANKSATVVRNLVVAVNNSNAKNPQHLVTVTGTDTADASGVYSFTGTVNSKVYTVTVTYDANGYINAITIA